MKKILYILCVLCLSAIQMLAQTVVSGHVSDQRGNPVPGVEFYRPEGLVRIGVSDENGDITIENTDGLEFLKYKMYQGTNYQGTVNIIEGKVELILNKADQAISLGKNITQSAGESTLASGSIHSDELSISSDVNVAKALYGRIAGLSVMQAGDDNLNGVPSLLIRGKNTFNSNQPLILVDGFARDMNNLTLAEIETITVLKDAAASAIYGVRGANGVINVTTKRGAIGKTQVSAEYKYNHYRPFRRVEMVDGATYAELYNEALVNDGLEPLYSDQELAAFKSGQHPMAYPNTDWYNESYNDFASGHLFDLTAQGGNDNFSYFTAFSYSNEEGLFKSNNYSQREDSDLKMTNANLRSNFDIKVHKNTKLKLNLLARLSEYQEPRSGVNEIAKAVYGIPASAFPVFGPKGNYASNNFYDKNPVAMINSSGFNERLTQTLYSDIRIEQDLSMVLNGLSAEAALSYDYNSRVLDFGTRDYAYEVITPTIDENGNVDMTTVVFGEDTPMEHGDNQLYQYMNNNIEAKINYSAFFNRNRLNASLIYEQSGYARREVNETEKRQSLMGYASLSLKDKYLFDAVVNYSGSSVLPEDDRFKVFPALSAAWLVSGEDFMSNSFVDYLKVRASAGLSGSDNIDKDLFRQYYVNGGTYYFSDNVVGAGGAHEGPLPAGILDYETVMKADLGFDLNVMDNRLQLVTDVFFERRENILIGSDKTISGVLGVDVSKQSQGIIENKGVELSGLWSDSQGDFKYQIGANISFIRNKIIENNEGYVPYAYLSKIGNSIGANYGLEAIGYFEDEADIQSSPEQLFSAVKPGDIKYKDQNGDEVIDQNDVIKFGESGATPEVYYGFQFDVEYKKIGLRANFQGVANRTIYTNSDHVFFPMKNGANISKYYVENNTHWTEATKATTNMPRLTTMNNENNFRPGTHWFKDGSYLKLRNIELYYNLDNTGIKGLQSRLFVRGTNLFSIDNLKEFDPENFSAGYPSVSSVTVGASLKF